VATVAEAFSSLLWAGTAALVAAEARHIWLPALLAVSALAIAWLLRPKPAG
jgi:ABC-2 type transport system permease protein